MLALEGVGIGALRGLDLRVGEGELFAVLCEQPETLTALMEMLAGLRPPNDGRVLLDSHDLFAGPAPQRHFAPPAEDAEAPGLQAVAAMLQAAPRLLLLDQPAARMPAAARATLLDMVDGERRRRGLTAVYATTDFAEVLALADRGAVIAGGALRQVGTPRELYEQPADLAVAMSTGCLNQLPGRIEEANEDFLRVRLDAGAVVEIEASGAEPGDVVAPAGPRCVVCVRPERIAVSTLPADQIGADALPAVLQTARFLGAQMRLTLAVGGEAAPVHIIALRHAALPPRAWVPGSTVSVAWQPHDAMLFAAEPALA